MRQRLCAFLLTLSATVVTGFANPILLDKTVAVVNDHVITQGNLDEAITIARIQAPEQIKRIEPAVLKKQMLNRLITQRLILSLAKAHHLHINEANVLDAVSQIERNLHLSATAFDRRLSANGLTRPAFIKALRQEILAQKYIQQSVAPTIQISPKAVDSYMQALEKERKGAARYTVAHILIPVTGTPTPANIAATKKQADAAYQAIHDGLPFEKAVHKYSKAPDALQGGKLTNRRLNDLPSAFVDTVQQLKPGEVAKPVHNANGFHIVKLIALQSDAHAPDQVTEIQIKRYLIKPSLVETGAAAKQQLNTLRTALIKTPANISLPPEATISTQWLNPSKQADHTLLKHAAALKAQGISEPFSTDAGWQIVQRISTRQTKLNNAALRQMATEHIFQRRLQEALVSFEEKIRNDAYIRIY